MYNLDMVFKPDLTLDYRLIFDSLLKRIELKDQSGLSAKLKKLRDRILYAHAKVEAKVDNSIQNQFKYFFTIGDDTSAEQFVYYGVGDLLECMDFRDKLRACEKLKILTKEQIRLITKLNELRNNFSHRKAEDLKIYENEQNFSEAIAIIIDSLIVMRIVIIPKKNPF